MPLKISREIKTAILVISGIVLFIFLFNYLKGNNLLDSSRTFYVEYDNVEGMLTSTPVTISGFPVGKVQDISFNKDGSGRLTVLLLVDNDFEFSKNSKAELYEAGLLGGKAIAIIPALDNAEKALAATPDWLFIPTPTIEILAKSGSASTPRALAFLANSFSFSDEPFISGVSIPFNRTENLYSVLSVLLGKVLAIVIVSPSYTFMTTPCVILGRKASVSFH